MNALTLTSRLSITHAALLLGSFLFVVCANWTGWRPLDHIHTFPYVYAWVCAVLAWPLWYVIVPLTSRGRRWQAVGALAVGTTLWIVPALPILGFSLMFLPSLWHSVPITNPLAGWKELGVLGTLEESSPGTVPDAIEQDAKAYFKTTPPDNPPDEEYMGPLDRYLEDGTGQHAVVVEVDREGIRWEYALIYDQNNRRIKVLKYAVGGYQS